jgi:hypothetical protein
MGNLVSAWRESVACTCLGVCNLPTVGVQGQRCNPQYDVVTLERLDCIERDVQIGSMLPLETEIVIANGCDASQRFAIIADQLHANSRLSIRPVRHAPRPPPDFRR